MPKAFLQIKHYGTYSTFIRYQVYRTVFKRFHFRIRPFFKYWDDSAGFPKNNQSIFMIQKFR